MSFIEIEYLKIELTRKNIRNLHLRVYPPDGRIKVSAPRFMPQSFIHSFILSRLPWIEKQQKKLQSQSRENYKEYSNGESHDYLGRAYSLRIEESHQKAQVELKEGELHLRVRPGHSQEKRKLLLNQWYRQELKKLIPFIVERYEPRLGVRIEDIGIKSMKTRWGTCNIKARRIWLNLELVKHPLECLEYVVVHEMVHLLEASHNKRFYNLMDQYYPRWRFYRDVLKQISLSSL